MNTIISAHYQQGNKVELLILKITTISLNIMSHKAKVKLENAIDSIKVSTPLITSIHIKLLDVNEIGSKFMQSNYRPTIPA